MKYVWDGYYAYYYSDDSDTMDFGDDDDDEYECDPEFEDCGGKESTERSIYKA